MSMGRLTYRTGATALITLALAIAGCGDDSSDPPSTAGKSDEQQIQDVYDAFLVALRDGDGSAACKLLTNEGKAGVLVGAAFLGEKPESCADAVKQLADASTDEDLKDVTLTNIEVTGATATATAERDDPGGELFAKVNDRWLISSSDTE